MIKEILEDTLTNIDKKYSSKKMISFVAFNLCVFMALVDMFTKYKVNIELFHSFLFVAGYSVTLTAVATGAKIKFKNDHEKLEEK